MITIQSAVEKIIRENLYLKEILASDYANISSIAKKIKKEVEKELLKNTSTNSIIVALTRLKKRLQKEAPKFEKIFLDPPEITLKGGLVEVVLPSEQEYYNKLNELARRLEAKEEFFALSKGFYEITAIFPQKYLKELKNQGFEPKKVFRQLTLISIKLPPKIVDMPGVYYKILQFIAFENIPLTEVFSTYTELMLFADQKHEDKLFETVRRLIKIL